jgi:adenosylmethionine-8-amino-7-oxononanoate aminotransferase
MAGVELLSEKRIGARICKRLLSSGIWLRPLGNVVVIMPPPIISDDDLKRLVRKLKEAILHELPH